MREIKFRGKRIDNGEWAFGAFIPDATEPTHGEMVTWGFIRCHKKELGTSEMVYVGRNTVGQYTGLKDKNGVEIYEGDLLQFEDYPPQEVVWEDGGFAGEDYYLADLYDGTVVIGNIHDNPELMEVE